MPEEVSVVGFDGTEVCEYSHPHLSTVRVPLHEIGARGAHLLLKQLERDKPQRSNQVLETQLQIGASTAPPRSK